MGKKVAIIGYSFRFPGCGQEDFWQALLDKKDLVTEVDPSRWSKEAHCHPSKGHPGTSYTYAAGSLGDISGFDAAFFGLSPREVMHMDPQQRLLLEMSWESMERAGIPPSSLRGSKTGVFMGVASGDYGYRFADDWASIGPNTGTGTAISIASNRISYFFDLRGPSMSMDTACSSSMVAFHQACGSILSGESVQALTGGISLHAHPYGFIIFSQATMLSPVGRCQTFDAAGDGYVRSEGGGVFLLKDYDTAIADGDPVLAVVAASAVNTDGYKSGLTVPSAQAQAELMTQAYACAGIHPDDIDYLEAHGTGTPVGDPIETKAIGDALGQQRSKPLPIGSVKSNLGHLETASGVAGLAKALFAIQHREVPATIGIKQLNPNIHFQDWNIDVNQETLQLDAQKPLTIGVNSFGFGGANAHVILQSPPSLAQPVSSVATSSFGTLPICISATSSDALQAAAENWADCLSSSGASLYDLAWASFTQRERHNHALLSFGDDKEALAQRFKQFSQTGAAIGVHSISSSVQAQGPVFVYSGNGCQWALMGQQLLAESEQFCESVAKVDELFAAYGDFSLLQELKGHNNSDRFAQTEIAQPALFALQVGITEWLRSRSIEPVAVVGHSVGEVAAAWACGALTLQQAVQVIYYRSYFQGKTAGLGQMTAVAVGAEEIVSLLQEVDVSSVCLASINSSKGVTVAGEVSGLEVLEMLLAQRGVRFKRLDLDYAFHSHLMDSVEAGIINALKELTPVEGNIPFISTVTGGQISGVELNADYWWRNVRVPVQFEGAIDEIIAAGHNGFVEIGGHPVLAGYTNDCLRGADSRGLVVSTLKRNQGSVEELSRAYAELLMAGIGFDLQRWFPVAGNRVELPTYPWRRQSYWHPVSAESQGLLARHYEHPLLGYRLHHSGLAWESQLDTARFSWLADHSVGDGVVFPGAGFVELALASAFCWKSPSVIDIEDFEIQVPLLLDAKYSKVVRTQIDADSGQISITSRELLGDEPPREHLKARFFAGTAGLMLNRTAPVVPQRDPDFYLADHLQSAAAVGLDYGPAFQAVNHGWIEGQQVIGVCQCTEVISELLPASLLHPGILDSALQLFIQLLKQEQKLRPRVGFVPVRVERIQFDAAAAGLAPHYLCLRQSRRSSHSLLADVEIFAADGRAVAVLCGVRFQPIPLRARKGQAVEWLDYELTPAPLCSKMSADLLQQWQNSALAKAESLLSEDEGVEEQEYLLSSLVNAFIDREFSGRSYQLQTLAGGARHWAQKLLVQGELRLDEEGYLLPGDSREPSELTPEQIWQLLSQAYPSYFPLIQSIGRFGLQLEPWLQGEATDFLPDERLFIELVRGITGAETLEKLATGWTRSTLDLLTHLPPGERLSVVEIAAGKPVLAHDLCAELDFNLADFTFLSASSESLSEARNQLQAFPLARVEAVDFSAESFGVSQIPAAQLVFIQLDEMSLADGRRSLRLAKKLSAVTGKIVVLGRHQSFWLDQVMSINPDWWLDDDETQQLSVTDWQRLLSDIGFEDIQLANGTGLGSFCLIGSVNEKTAQLTLDSDLADENNAGNISDGVSDSEGKKPCLLILGAASSHSLMDRLREFLLDDDHYHAIHNIEGVSTLADALASMPFDCSNTQLLIVDQLFNRATTESQIQLCTLLRDIYCAIESQSRKVECWLLTSSVASMFHPDAAPQLSAQEQMDAAVWGFVRTLMNEASRADYRLLDLPTQWGQVSVKALNCGQLDDGLKSVAGTLKSQRASSALDEDELFIFTDGSRYAPRLKLKPQFIAAVDKQQRQTATLGFDLPGQLRNLTWGSTIIAEPGAGEVEVQVAATGLNFRDVMYALGMLSDEAIENGFSGPTLGLEFSGRIVAVGPDVTEFRIGDEVVGFGPSSFSARLIAGVNTIARIPSDCSMESAATIPTTFFTVYYALKHLAQLQPGERILIHGAAGGVGLAAIQVARYLGAEIYATVGSRAKRDVIRLLGVDHIYDSRSVRFAEEILCDTADGRGVDVVLNSLAGEAINQNLRVLKPFGRFLELGKRDFYENTHIGLRPFRNNISYFGIDSDQLMSEKPELTATLFREMMALFEAGELYPLPYTSFSADKVVEAFRFMQQARQIGKVIVNYRQQPKVAETEGVDNHQKLSLDPNATYLVTGGLSGFGLKTAFWLADKGARQLLLVSRSGRSAEIESTLVQLEDRGVAVSAMACDVTDRAAMQALFNHIASDLPPLKGVIHAATVFADSLAINMSDEQIKEVMLSKMEGANLLHELTQSIPLDLFVLFSSATTCFGNPGQSNYVAANHWLEALAVRRRTLGLAATCVRWGAIDDVGYLARNEQVKEMLENRMGGKALHSDLALAQLEKILLQERTLCAVMELEWPALSRFLPNAQAPKFREIALLGDDNQDGGASAAELVLYLQGLSAEEQHEEVVALLRKNLSQILMLPEDQIDADTSVFDLGFDSLMGVELMVAIEERFGVQLPAMTLSEATTLNKLAVKLLGKLFSSDDSGDTETLDYMAIQHGLNDEELS